MEKGNNHYSYTVYAKDETARNFEKERFGGPIGSYLRMRQEKQLLDWIKNPSGLNILDVGAGTGRTAIPLASAGARVTAADASEAMLAEAKRKAERADVSINFQVCDAMELPYDDQAFGSVICLRVLMHVVDWRRALSQACRCAEETVLLDFPPRWALAALQVPARAVASIFRPSIQRFRTFSLRQIRSELRTNGFAIEKVDKLWVLPIALHKLVRSRIFTLGIEKLFSVIGLRALFGAPVTVLARRIGTGAM